MPWNYFKVAHTFKQQQRKNKEHIKQKTKLMRNNDKTNYSIIKNNEPMEWGQAFTYLGNCDEKLLTQPSYGTPKVGQAPGDLEEGCLERAEEVWPDMVRIT
ncbi:hypothetical protein CHS0354_011878 [Potamilus streckersoni]|uniref:Uncharacterized protein n=1 Tax=Potamilus streckersoni TaxID=2493646 RepID=A0AAE0T733_9BIVA|nr:hypothetical protein CHS0354_011878 [Potamilus streckersoni]